MADKSAKPRITVELAPGDYIVTVHPAFQQGRGYRVWRVQTNGMITGPGGKLKRIAVWDAVRDLTIAAEREEGIYP
jgi:hypothetical protein